MNHLRSRLLDFVNRFLLCPQMSRNESPGGGESPKNSQGGNIYVSFSPLEDEARSDASATSSVDPQEVIDEVLNQPPPETPNTQAAEREKIQQFLEESEEMFETAAETSEAENSEGGQGTTSTQSASSSGRKSQGDPSQPGVPKPQKKRKKKEKWRESEGCKVEVEYMGDVDRKQPGFVRHGQWSVPVAMAEERMATILEKGPEELKKYVRLLVLLRRREHLVIEKAMQLLIRGYDTVGRSHWRKEWSNFVQTYLKHIHMLSLDDLEQDDWSKHFLSLAQDFDRRMNESVLFDVPVTALPGYRWIQEKGLIQQTTQRDRDMVGVHVGAFSPQHVRKVSLPTPFRDGRIVMFPRWKDNRNPAELQKFKRYFEATAEEYEWTSHQQIMVLESIGAQGVHQPHVPEYQQLTNWWEDQIRKAEKIPKESYLIRLPNVFAQTKGPTPFMRLSYAQVEQMKRALYSTPYQVMESQQQPVFDWLQKTSEWLFEDENKDRWKPSRRTASYRLERLEQLKKQGIVVETLTTKEQRPTAPVKPMRAITKKMEGTLAPVVYPTTASNSSGSRPTVFNSNPMLSMPPSTVTGQYLVPVRNPAVPHVIVTTHPPTVQAGWVRVQQVTTTRYPPPPPPAQSPSIPRLPSAPVPYSSLRQNSSDSPRD